MKKVFVFLIAIFVLSCGGSYTNQSNSLKKILANYNTAIPDSEHTYILRSDFCCKGCVQRMFIQIEKLVAEKTLSNITVIATDKSYLSEAFLGNIDYLEDKRNSVDAYFPNSVNLTLIRTIDGKIVKFKVLETTDPEIYPNEVNDFFKDL